ncbi:MAG: putative membrane protein [Halopseudomonas sp.]
MGLFSLIFLLIGVRWLVVPTGAAGQLGMPLLDDVGRSTQIGDLAAFFLTLGVVILLALVTSQRIWYYPAAILLGIAAVGRVLAWAVHDAALALDLIVPEVIIAAVLLLASRRLGKTG